MTNEPFTVIIPARLASTRLPEKVLLDIAGKPMVRHVYERACESGAERVIVAARDLIEEIEQPSPLIERYVGLIAGRLPSKRPMDNVAVSLDLPQEEELALAAESRLSAVHQLSFPGRAREIVAKMGAMRLTGAEMREWRDSYLRVLRKATLASDGRRLVLKTPANLGRTALLLSLFPGAKFVFVVRNPYVVFSSTIKLYRTLIPMYRLQDVDWEAIEASVLSNYVDMTRRYLRDRASIPKGSLIEVRFEDVEADAMGVLERVYGALGLPGWERARKPVAEYLETLSGYRKNRYRFDRSLIDKVDREWGFAVREWGYEPP